MTFDEFVDQQWKGLQGSFKTLVTQNYSATWSNIGCSPDSLDVLEAVDGVEPVASPQPRGEIRFTILHISRNLKDKVLWWNLEIINWMYRVISQASKI